MKRLLIVILIFCAQGLCAQSTIQITFENDEIGRFPSGWGSRDHKNGARVYSIQADGEKKFLHADAQDASVQITYDRKWDIRDYPKLCWRWRAVIFPAGSNEQIKSGNDSVLGIYVLLSGLPFITAIKYIWSDTLPIGTAFNSPHSSGTKIMAIRSGRALAGTWVTEERDVLSDYERFFEKGDKHPLAHGIAILTDSDNTHSRAVGDYADIVIMLSK